MYRKRYLAGYTQELDLRRIEADRLATEALVYRRENELSQAGTALAMLLGRSPAAIVQGFPDEGRALEELNVFPRIPEDIPSDLLDPQARYPPRRRHVDCCQCPHRSCARGVFPLDSPYRALWLCEP